MRYIVAIVVAGLIIGSAALFVRQMEQSLKQLVRQAIKDGQTAGHVRLEIDPENFEIENLEVQLPARFQMQLTFAYALKTWRFVLMPAVLLTSLGIALVLGRWRP